MILTADQVAALRAEAASDRAALVARLYSRRNAAADLGGSPEVREELARGCRYANAVLTLLGERGPAPAAVVEQAATEEATP